MIREGKLPEITNQEREQMSKRAEDSLSVANDLKEYEFEMVFSIDQYRGKKVLDLGSGIGELFAKQASTHGVDVVSLNPKLKSRSVGEIAIDAIEKKLFPNKYAAHKNRVAAMGQELPFKDESFDVIISMFSVPFYLSRDPQEHELALREMVRVIKPGGEIRVRPPFKCEMPNDLAISSSFVETTYGSKVQVIKKL